MMDPGLHSAIADTFRSGAEEIKAQANGPDRLSIFFSAAVAGVELLFDQLAISSANSAAPQRAVLGPFVVADYKAGQYVLLRRNPHYWQTDPGGNKLPYIDSIRLDIQANRDTELFRFRRGELHFVDKLDPEVFDRLRKEMPSAAVDAGASLDSELLWFNQFPDAPFPPYKLRWFQSKRFRRALSAALQREDIVRLVYHGYGRPALGPVSESNKLWVNSKLRPQRYDPKESLRLLEQDGFRLDGETLRDRDGHAVEFSLITNAGSKIRAQIGAMVQQDWKKIGIRLNFTPLEFQSLIERITRTQQYEACLLGFANVDPDPSGGMNVWLSSSTHHAWNPGQKTAATPWESEIDTLMKAQATAMNPQLRKKAFDRVQEIISDEAPILFLVNPKVLAAVSPALRGAAPSPLPPHLYWNIEHLSLAAPARRRER
jgi:peptide/nickel transport system substrate-binding protein